MVGTLERQGGLVGGEGMDANRPHVALPRELPIQAQSG
jgi:hypothetical protein